MQAAVVDLFEKETAESALELLAESLSGLGELSLDSQVEFINKARLMLHDASPFKAEPVDCVLWVKSDDVVANDYNPNSVAPPEMKLLAHSIGQDGYTQPIVAWRNGDLVEVVDGFHRHRVGKETASVRKRVHGYLPVTIINGDRTDRNDRISSTIRHNRARGKHKVEAMSDIVIELKRRNWTDERISRELGMDQDEILRLCQITGLAELFSDQEFSKSWDVEGEITEADFESLSEADVDDDMDVRVANTSNEHRVFHTYEKWECYKAGFYATTAPNGMKKDQCEIAYRDFLSDSTAFEKGLDGVISEWKHSCEHYLTNTAMNRIAWLGQAAMCYATGISAQFRSGFSLQTEEQQQASNELALQYLNKWLASRGMEAVTMEEACSYDRQSGIY